jgi:hypothetical protein
MGPFENIPNNYAKLVAKYSTNCFVDVIFTINYERIKETNVYQFGVLKEYNSYVVKIGYLRVNAY